MSYPVHHPYSSLTPAMLRPYVTAAFIETGTNVGHGIACAIEAGFPRVWSIEADPIFVSIARTRFAQELRVTIVQGSSPDVLRAMMPAITVPYTIYLDAHNHFAHNPLLDELDAIRLSPCMSHTILIDDVRMFGSPDWEGLELVDALAKLRTINPSYQFSYVDTPNAADDLLVAQVL